MPGNIRWTDSNTTKIVEASEVEFTRNLAPKGYADGTTELTVDIKLIPKDDPRGITNGV
jgi:hypothetical protein